MNLFRKNFIKNSLVKVYRNISIIGQGIILAPLVISTLGLKFASIWFLITQFAAYVQLAEFGIPTGLTRISSHYLALNDKKNLGEIAISCLLFLLLIASVISFFSQELVGIFISAFNLAGSPDGTKFALKFALIITAINLPLRCGISILESQQKFYVHLWVETVFVILRVCVLYLIAYLNILDLTLLSLIYFGANFLIHATQFILAIKLITIANIRDTFRNIPTHLKQIFTIGVSAMIVTASATTLRQGTPLLFGLVHGIGEGVALFSITMLLVASIMQLLTVPISFVGPLASQLHAKNKINELYSTFLLFSKYSLIFATFISIAFATIGKAFLNLWLDIGQSEIHTIYHLTFVIIISFSFSIPSLYARMILSFVNKHTVTSILELTIVLIGLFIGYINIVKLDLGLLGMAYAVAAIFLLRSFGPLMLITVRCFKIDIKKYLADVYLKYTILILTLIPFYILLSCFFLNEYVIHSSTLILFAVLAWVFMLENVHKEKMKHLLGITMCQQ